MANGASTGGGVIEDDSLTSDQILDLLNDDDDDDEGEKDDDKSTDDDKKVTDTKDDDNSDESDDDDSDDDDDADKDDDKGKKKDKIDLKDDESDEDDDDEGDEKLITPVRRQEILKAFPTLFKKFPYLEKAYYSDQQFRELFGTIDDAKEVQEKAETLDNYEAELSEGNTENILKAVKATDEDSFHKLVDDYLGTLQRVDENAYYHVIGDVVKNVIVSMVNEGKRTDNKQLRAAAQLTNQFIFGTSEFSPSTKLSAGDSDGENKLEKEREEFIQERFETARDDLSSRVNNVLKGTIDGAIDPKESMSAFVKKHAVRDAMTSLEEAIRGDSEFMKIIDNLWKKASNTKFNTASIKKIRTVYLSKAKTLLPAVIKKSRREALKGTGQKSSEGSKRRSSESGQRTRRSLPKKRSDDGRGISTFDFLNQD